MARCNGDGKVGLWRSRLAEFDGGAKGEPRTKPAGQRRSSGSPDSLSSLVPETSGSGKSEMGGTPILVATSVAPIPLPVNEHRRQGLSFEDVSGKPKAGSKRQDRRLRQRCRSMERSLAEVVKTQPRAKSLPTKWTSSKKPKSLREAPLETLVTRSTVRTSPADETLHGAHMRSSYAADQTVVQEKYADGLERTTEYLQDESLDLQVAVNLKQGAQVSLNCLMGNLDVTIHVYNADKAGFEQIASATKAKVQKAIAQNVGGKDENPKSKASVATKLIRRFEGSLLDATCDEITTDLNPRFPKLRNQKKTFGIEATVSLDKNGRSKTLEIEFGGLRVTALVTNKKSSKAGKCLKNKFSEMASELRSNPCCRYCNQEVLQPKSAKQPSFLQNFCKFFGKGKKASVPVVAQV